ncbi:hypothetical protein NDI76_19475 [Halogeometricum sp. S1BR25-6]|uniref:Uncharacterized protein n=1 Tax=Halogeometricum salsisoli TaxID=2950536 RepID=A0ABU2GJE3_9EURY|nr:hypothetical protein [Halogeometricum sp. S1BR25-6]MDS0300931.1 hypothetical protein [Halogeometricum sp. S1BR25-6]
MSDRSTTFDDHDPLAYSILQVLEDFIDEVGSRECTAHFDKVVDGKYFLKGKHLIQKPERFTEEHLVFPMLRRAFGYSLRPQPMQYAPRWPRGGGVPDFCITSIPIAAAMESDLRFFGEVKPPKKIENARNDMVNYLDSDLDVHAVAILTDGFEWEIWIRPKGESVDDLDNPYAKASLRDSLKTVRTRNMKTAPYQPHRVRNNIDTDIFSDFMLDAVLETIETEFGVDTTAF